MQRAEVGRGGTGALSWTRADAPLLVLDTARGPSWGLETSSLGSWRGFKILYMYIYEIYIYISYIKYVQGNVHSSHGHRWNPAGPAAPPVRE